MYLHPSNNPATVRRAAMLPLLLALAAICLTPLFVRAPREPGAVGFQPAPAVQPDFGRLPLLFVENRGQLDPQVAYAVQGRDKTIYFTPAGLTVALTNPAVAPDHSHDPWALRAAERAEPPAPNRWVIRQEFVGATPGIRPVGQEQADALISYFTGPVAQHQTGLRTYQRLVYPNLWPGIDLVYAGTVNRMKYEFIVQPGANPTAIRLAYHGATDVRVTADGQLEVLTPLGNLTDAAPLAYQEINGAHVPVSMAYALDDAAAGQPRSYGFALGVYDPAYPLVLDPAILVYAGYIGGAGNDEGYGMAVDQDGNAYISGQTTSNQASFPVTVGPDLSHNGGVLDYDVFVAKVNTEGTALIYAGYIGGAGQDTAHGLAVDEAGNVYVTGSTVSHETTFPVTVGPDLTLNGARDAFVAKVNAEGTALVYAGYVGGIYNESSYGITVDRLGNAYITGAATFGFPVVGGPGLTFAGPYSFDNHWDAFVAKIDTSGTDLVYAGYIGGINVDWGQDIAVDDHGQAYIVGQTLSDESSFPVTVGPDLTYNGDWDAFVAKVASDGSDLVYAGYIGGASTDVGLGITVDPTGNVYLTGGTASDETTFPVIIGPDLSYNGGPPGSGDAFIAKLNPSGTSPLYIGYIGGAGADYGNDVAVDRLGHAYIVGGTRSNEASFPVLLGPDLTYNDAPSSGDPGDAFVAQVKADGTVLVYAGYIGGAENDLSADAIAVDHVGNIYISGSTQSSETTFPVTGGPDLTYNGSRDAFVAKVSASYTLSSITGRVANTNNVPLAGVTLTASDGGSTTTDASGIYTLTDILSGTLTLTPTFSGYTFAPLTRTVSVPPDAAGQDFTAANRPPFALDDSAVGTEDTPLIIDVTANDSDPDAGDTPAVVLVGAPVHGSVAISGATQLIYTPTVNFAGSDVLTYTVSDGEIWSTASVSITILPVNDPPVVTSTNALTIAVHTGSGPINVLIGDPDDPPGGLTVTVVSSNSTLVPPANIVLSGSGAQRTLTITPAAGQIGVAPITITVRDAGGRSAQATLRFAVTGFRQYLPLIRK